MANLELQISQLPSLAEPTATDLVIIKRGLIDYKMTYSEFLKSHITNFSNPHNVTKVQIGLGNVINTLQLSAYQNFLDVPDKGAARTNLDVLSSSEVVNLINTQHANKTDNPHNVTKAQVGLPDINNGNWSDSFNLSSSNTYATSKAVADGVTSAKTVAASNLAAHLSAVNPHNITKALIGLGSVLNSSGSADYNSGAVSDYANLKAVKDAYTASVNNANSLMSSHLASANPHNITKATIGLSNVLNNAGSDSYQLNSSSSYATSKAVYDGINYVISLLNNTASGHALRTDNPHQVTAAQIGLGNVMNNGGNSSYTTNSTAYYANSKAVYDGVNHALAVAASSLSSHASASNPHNITASKVGLGNVMNNGGSSSYTTNSTSSYANSKAVYDGVSYAISIAQGYTNAKIRPKRTLLFSNSSGLDGGNITLSQSYRNFDKLEVYGAPDGRWAVSVTEWWVDQIDIASTYNSQIELWHMMKSGWRGRFTSNTFFTTGDQDCRIYAIYGVNY